MAEICREEVIKTLETMEDQLVTALSSDIGVKVKREDVLPLTVAIQKAIALLSEPDHYTMGNAIAFVKTALGIVADIEPENHAAIKKYLWKACEEMGKAL